MLESVHMINVSQIRTTLSYSLISDDLQESELFLKLMNEIKNITDQREFKMQYDGVECVPIGYTNELRLFLNELISKNKISKDNHDIIVKYLDSITINDKGE